LYLLLEFLGLLLTLSGLRWIGKRIIIRLRKVFALKAFAWMKKILLLCDTFRQLFEKWHSQRFYRNLVTNLAIGLAITWLLLVFVSPYPVLMDLEDEGLDLVMQIRKEMIPPRSEKNIPPFVFLDIDDKTHQAWGEPLFTPRHRLKTLIETAVKAQARLVIVDVNLSQPTPIEGLRYTKPLHPYDQALHDYLANYANFCQQQSTCPTIIFAKTFRAVQSSSGTNIGYFSLQQDIPIPEWRTSFLDTAVSQSGPYLQWASPLFFLSADDPVIRHWWLWQPVCEHQQVRMMPSIELLVAALIRHETPEQAQAILAQTLSPFQPVTCQSYVPPQLERIQIGQLTVSTEMRSIRQRIMYTMPWLVDNRPPYLPHALTDSEGSTILTIFPAQGYAELPSNVDLTALKDAIVIIGGSYSDGGDVHLTPLGNMPGPLILVNAIHSLLQYEQIEEISIWYKLLLQAGLIILISLLSAWLVKFAIKYRLGFLVLFWFNVSVGAVVILVVLPFTVVFLGYGIWLDFMIPLLLVQINQTVLDFEEMLEQYQIGKIQSVDKIQS
jgi:CHASE2 domain-containing sensor protein